MAQALSTKDKMRSNHTKFNTKLTVQVVYTTNASYTVARIMSTTLKIGIWGGWLTSQLEKKFKLLYPYRNIWTHGIQFINANNCHASVNVFTIYSIFWIWMSRIGPASRNKIFVFCCKYLAFLLNFWH